MLLADEPTGELHRFEQENKDGVISRYQFSVWYNGSVRTASYFHNMIGILTETGHASATPFTYNSVRLPGHALERCARRSPRA